ncbi:ROK family transcriptional regulator [Myceligenerans xiligouense]|uniref:Putative NBD/HSP70 family sugar kinase n=1 Tax=Myceligenerans xiligouense TaxID=253184 RepID=A0A3N4YFF2_9MICO|nr:ROK family transcriptional regulator [Myceligenerans xiligouense]RPF19879.1 putative NBD/HSP70 family sugar kinase [Myceligenerans xiligouense]
MTTTSAASRQHTLRERNLELVARAVFEAPEPPSRAGVAATTGLTRATVSTLIDQLIGARLLRELPAVADGRAGRPAVPLVPAGRSVLGLGLEVNVDYLGARAIDLTGAVVAERVVPGAFHDSDPAEVLGELGRIANDIARDTHDRGMRLAGARLALPGLVDARAGVLDVAPNLGWSSVAPVPLLGLAGLPVEIANEAKLAALAELGGPGPAGAGAAIPDSFLYVSGDVGIGAAIVVGRELFLGERGWNGEVGHVVVDPAGPRCSCGARGCLEQFAGKEALAGAAGLAADAPLADLLALLGAPRPTTADAGGDPAASDADPPTTAHTGLDSPASRAAADAAVRRAGQALGSALADFVNLVDVHTVVLGGIYTDLLPWLRPEVESVLAERVLAAPFVELEVRSARAGAQAALTGGAHEVLRAVLAAPAAWT